MNISEHAILTTDGGSDGRERGAAAAILSERSLGRCWKVTAFIGGATGNEAELCGAILGFCLYRYFSECVLPSLPSGSASPVHWETDSQYLLRTSEGLGCSSSLDSIPNAGLWRAFLDLKPAGLVSQIHVPAHAGHGRNERCDSACRWIQQKGAQLLAQVGSGPIGRNAVTAPRDAWVLVDWRDLLTACRSRTRPNYQLLLESLRATLVP
ncbi:MAG: RNase H family protein [Bdellovibrionota bacterium]